MNRFREKIVEEEELEEQGPFIKQEEEKRDEPATPPVLRRFLEEGSISKETATNMLPFILFLGFVGMLYIANSHLAVRNIRKIDRLNKEVKELSWEYKSLKADLMFRSKMTEVAKKVDTLGLKELIEPPRKLIVNLKK